MDFHFFILAKINCNSISYVPTAVIEMMRCVRKLLFYTYMFVQKKSKILFVVFYI